MVVLRFLEHAAVERQPRGFPIDVISRIVGLDASHRFIPQMSGDEDVLPDRSMASIKQENLERWKLLRPACAVQGASRGPQNYCTCFIAPFTFEATLSGSGA